MTEEVTEEVTDGVALDLSAPRTVHLVGVGGAGMSAIALVLARMGHRVSGSDLKHSSTLERLRLEGVVVATGHDPSHLPDPCDAVVTSTAVPGTNPEVRAARERGVPVLRRCDALREITRMRRSAVVSGTHGKTTTTSMLALILRAAGWRPSFIVGGEVNEVGTNAALDEGEWLVVEGDESDGTFLELEREAALVTNVEPDHLEHWGGFTALVGGFRDFVSATRGPVVVCGDDPVAADLCPERPPLTYGASADADYRIEDWTPEGPGSRFVLHGPEGRLGVVRLPVPGRHNAWNAAGAAALALELGVPFEAARTALGRFGGVSRRFEFRGQVGGVTLVDDYAHLPTEVAATIAAARHLGGRRVVAAFQPHRYSRTAGLWRDFARAFEGADVVVLTDVYSAGETPRPGVSGHLILDAVLEGGTAARVVYLPKRADLVRHLPALTRPGDVLLTLGAGDITTVADELLAGERGEGGG